MACTTEENEISFPTLRDFVEHEKSGHKIMPKVEATKPVEVAKTADNPPPAPVLPVQQSKKEPIILVYKFLGNCDICNNPIDTIKVELGSKNMMIAYCPTDKKQWTSQEVVPIELQSKQIEKKK